MFKVDERAFAVGHKMLLVHATAIQLVNIIAVMRSNAGLSIRAVLACHFTLHLVPGDGVICFHFDFS
jgi:hypothetical protein